MRARDLVDALLELSIVGSFSRPGYLARRRLYEWTDPIAGALAGKTVLITEMINRVATQFGGVSVFAVQLATAAGVRVIGTSSSDAKLDRLVYDILQLQLSKHAIILELTY